MSRDVSVRYMSKFSTSTIASRVSVPKLKKSSETRSISRKLNKVDY